MAKRIDVKDLEHLLRRLQGRRGRDDDGGAALGDRLHRAVRLRQVDRPAHPQPDARGDPRRSRRGQGHARRPGPLRLGRSTRWPCAAPSAWCSSGRTRSRRCRSTTTSRRGCGSTASRTRRSSTRSSSSRCTARTCGTRSRTASTSPAPASPAASSSGCASRAPSPCKPQVLLMDEPCSALDPISTLAIEDLINELKSRVHDRHRHAQHAAGRPGLGPDGVLQPRGHRQARPARRGRRHPEDLQQPHARRPPRTTSPAASADPTSAPRSPDLLPRHRPASGARPPVTTRSNSVLAGARLSAAVVTDRTAGRPEVAAIDPSTASAGPSPPPSACRGHVDSWLVSPSTIARQHVSPSRDRRPVASHPEPACTRSRAARDRPARPACAMRPPAAQSVIDVAPRYFPRPSASPIDARLGPERSRRAPTDSPSRRSITHLAHRHGRTAR